jgi:hypothetical protein
LAWSTPVISDGKAHFKRTNEESQLSIPLNWLRINCAGFVSRIVSLTPILDKKSGEKREGESAEPLANIAHLSRRPPTISPFWN